PTFRFSAGFEGPDPSFASRLTRPDDASAHPGVRTQPHVSEAVVSKALARSTRRRSAGASIQGPVSLAFDRNLITGNWDCRSVSLSLLRVSEDAVGLRMQ